MYNKNMKQLLILLIFIIISTGCSSRDGDTLNKKHALLTTAISRQIDGNRVVIKNRQVWLDGKKIGCLDSDDGGYINSLKILPDGSNLYKVTDLNNGWLFVSGGDKHKPGGDFGIESKKTFFWDKAKKKFINGPDMTCQRSGYEVTPLPDNKWLITGGAPMVVKRTKTEEYATSPMSVDILDLKTKTITQGGSLLVDRVAHSVLSLDKKRVLIAGGHTFGGKTPNGMESKSVELYNLDTHTSKEIGELCRARQAGTLIRLNENEVLLVGGYNSDSEEDDHNLPPEIIKLPN